MPNNYADALVMLSIEQGIATLTLNNTSKRNSLDREMTGALNDRLDEIWAARDQLKGVLLCAAGDHFMVGGDIRYFQTMLGQPDVMKEGIAALITDLNRAVSRIDTLPFPVIALVQGSVAGAGLSLALACDMIIAADDARFVLAYSALGATPDGGATWQLSRRVGQQRALHMYLFNEPLNADQALNLGLVAQVVPRSALPETQHVLAQRLSSGSRLAQNAGKALIGSGTNTDFATALQNERTQFVELAGHDDFHEGVDAFMRKRTPDFKL